MNNCMSKNQITQKRWISSQKHATQQDRIRSRIFEQVNNKKGDWISNPRLPNTENLRTRLASFIYSTKELKSILLKLFQKAGEEGSLPNSFYQASIIVIAKLGKDTTRKLQINIPNVNAELFNNISKLDLQHGKD